MKRTLVTALSLILTTAAFAADTQRYLVGTNRPMGEGVMAAMKQMVGEDFETRGVVGFRSFTGFAADLTAEEAATLRQSGEVRWVERVVERRALVQERNPMKQTVPHGLNTVFARQAQLGVHKSTINVVVADTGIDYHHPDLAPAYAGGWNIFTKTEDPIDDEGHGTHVSGTIIAADNGFGLVGVAPKARLWVVKMLDGEGVGLSEGLVQTLDWIIKKKKELGGNWILNLSLGAYEESEGEREAFQNAADQGILIVAAAGNLSVPTIPSPVAFPAAYPSVVGVSATTFDRKHADFSGQGPELDLAAPGVDVLSTWPIGTNEISFLGDGDEAIFANELTGSKRGVISAEFVHCGTGRIGDFPSNVAGKIALIQRGDGLSFSEKTRRAMEAGAIAVAIYDNVEVPTAGKWTLYNTDADREIDWPIALRLTMQTGQALIAKGSHVITVAYTDDDYGENTGTSMAAPHVVGAAALAWSYAPDATAAQVINALLTTAIDLGPPGHDSLFGAGLVNAYGAARMLAPSAFGNITTGRPIGMRGRK